MACSVPASPRQEPSILATRSNEILTAVVQGARKEETSPDVQAAAIQALYNSLEFIRDNFDREVGGRWPRLVVCGALMRNGGCCGATGRAQLHYAGRVRGDPVALCRRPGRRL